MKKLRLFFLEFSVIMLVHKFVFAEIHEPTLWIHYEPITWTTDSTYEYGDDTQNGRYDIISDFGPRTNPPTSLWHKGVDFNFASGDTDIGDHIKAFESGSIARIYGSANHAFSLTMADLRPPR